MKNKLNGYDFDGVITAGVRPKSPSDVIITGRSYEESLETYSYLHRHGIYNAVYFMPYKFDDKHPNLSAEWKAFMIGMLNVETFHEDEIRQANIIKASHPNLEVVLVTNEFR